MVGVSSSGVRLGYSKKYPHLVAHHWVDMPVNQRCIHRVLMLLPVCIPILIFVYICVCYAYIINVLLLVLVGNISIVVGSFDGMNPAPVDTWCSPISWIQLSTQLFTADSIHWISAGVFMILLFIILPIQFWSQINGYSWNPAMVGSHSQPTVLPFYSMPMQVTSAHSPPMILSWCLTSPELGMFVGHPFNTNSTTQQYLEPTL